MIIFIIIIIIIQMQFLLLIFQKTTQINQAKQILNSWDLWFRPFEWYIRLKVAKNI